MSAKGSGASPSRTGDWTIEALVDIEVVDDKKASWSTALICVIAVGRRLLNISSASSACMSSQFTHWLSESGYPFHLTRYCTLRPLPWRLESRTFSTSYSSAPSIRSGGGRWKLGPWKSVSLYGVRRSTWNTSCIFQVTGSVS